MRPFYWKLQLFLTAPHMDADSDFSLLLKETRMWRQNLLGLEFLVFESAQPWRRNSGSWSPYILEMLASRIRRLRTNDNPFERKSCLQQCVSFWLTSCDFTALENRTHTFTRSNFRPGRRCQSARTTGAAQDLWKHGGRRSCRGPESL